jgi:hypothetical protein
MEGRTAGSLVIFAAAIFVLGGCGQESVERGVPSTPRPGEASTPRAAPREDPFAIDPDLRARALAANHAAPSSRLREVPFVSLEIDRRPVRLLLDPVGVRSTLALHDGRRIAFRDPGVPVALASMSEGRILAIFRSFPTNRLEALMVGPSGTVLDRRSLGRQDDGYLFFRAMLASTERVLLIVYDNRTRQNRLLGFPARRSGLATPTVDVVLPSLEDPAGINYEMDPPIFLLEDEPGGLRILGGTLDARLDRHGSLAISRRTECVRILEAVRTSVGTATLCDLKAGAGSAIYRVRDDSGFTLDFGARDGVPWRLRASDSGGIAWSTARSASERRELLVFDLSRAQNSGLLELGSNNVEGRIPWAQIYYLNGLLDLLEIAARDRYWYETYAPLIPLVRQRLDLEFAVLDRVLASRLGFHTRAFTVGRVPALFAVQTGRLLPLLERYAREIPGAIASPHLDQLRSTVFELRGHIDTIRSGGESPRWIPPDRRYLAWPKGSAFPFDGLPVPFNHQNEWAWGLFETARIDPRWQSHPSFEVAKEVIEHFAAHILRDMRFPADGRWPYWWGRAVEGWTAADGVSINTPEYPGDKGLAWISFRTIDLFGVLSARFFMSSLQHQSLLDSASALVADGLVYPFAAGALARHGRFPLFEADVAARYARSGAPSDLSSAVWVLGRPPAEPKPDR